MALTLITPPAVEPISLDTAKQHLRVDASSNAEDTLLEVLIAAARAWAEGETRRTLITQTWEVTFPAFPSPNRDGLAQLVFPKAPLQSIESVKYIDWAGDLQTLDASTYLVRPGALPGRLELAYDADWPDTRPQSDAVIIRFVSGYGDAAADVPAPIRAAILLMLGDLYANREGQIVGTIVNENPTAKALLAPYRVLEAV